MSALPELSKLAGPHMPIYDAYYKASQPDAEGHVTAMNAARFLKKSNLSDVILSKIWDLSDPQSKGFLDMPGMYVALKLCALAQQGYNLSMANIYTTLPPPKMEGVKINTSSATAPPPKSCDWSIKPSEFLRYEELFCSLQPIDGYIPGNKVKGLLMDSKLPIATLGKIWDLADMDKDGKLDKFEFIIAMHLVYKALENYAIPTVLPEELLKIRNNSEPTIAVSKAPSVQNIQGPPKMVKTAPGLPELSKDWIVSAADQAVYDQLFIQSDKDMDGYVSGLEVKDVFIKSGLPQQHLALIWNLCDLSKSGKLNKEQFALAMWLIKYKLQGNELPNCLSQEMVPPSFRNKTSVESSSENNNVCEYSNPELEMINKDIKDILKEKHFLEQDIAQKEADITIKTGEIKSLQNELDTLAATLKQLENQKGEANKRLCDLKSQVLKLKLQAEEHESTLQVQMDELNSKRQELEALKNEEQALEQQQNNIKECLKDLTNNSQSIQLQTSQIKAVIIHLNEQHQQMLDAITQYEAALAAGDASLVPESVLLFRSDIQNLLPQNDDNKTTDNKENINNENEIRNQEKLLKDFEATKTNKFEDDPFDDDPFAALHAPPKSSSPSPALPPKKSKQPPPRPAPPRMAPSSNVFPEESDPFAAKTANINDNSGFANFANFDSKPAQVVDFVDDPFKDYRYEDTSKFADPFLDNN